MSKVIMMVGLPASKKSTYAKKLSEKENAIILSSDEMRQELFGDVNHQSSNSELFQELHKRAKEHLNNGQNVIIDATNISQRRRNHFINEFKQYQKEVVYMSAHFTDCMMADKYRERSVGLDVINRMYKQLQIPMKEEGWDKVVYKFPKTPYYGTSFINNVISNDVYDHDDLFDELKEFSFFEDVLNLPHDSSYHSLSVSRHTYHVWKYVLDNYTAGHKYVPLGFTHEDRLQMVWAALLHDIGKSWCKEFKDGSRFANFIGHENVSAQIAMNFLYESRYDLDFILDVVKLVQNHMRLLNDPNGKSERKLHEMYGDDFMRKLLFLREADEQAH